MKMCKGAKGVEISKIAINRSNNPLNVLKDQMTSKYLIL